jgi:hypothetical protein
MRKSFILLIICILPVLAFAKEFPVDSIINLNQFKLTNQEKGLLKNNGFVVSRDSLEQLFEIYVSNWWDGVPNFVSTDLVLQLFHLFFSVTLRKIEGEILYFKLIELSTKMLDKLASKGDNLNYWSNDYDYRIHAYFGVASRLLGIEVNLPQEIDSKCKIELKLIEKHSERTRSAIFPFDIDYSQFIPRGHYTRSERLKKYFKVMMWYGLIPFPLEDEELNEDDIISLTKSAIRITLNLAESDSLINLWDEIYDITSLFVGKSESYTPREYLIVLEKMLENEESYASNFAENVFYYIDEKIDFFSRFKEELKKLRQPKIKQVAIRIPTGLQFCLLGQRYEPDSDIIQKLINWPERPFPKGLDVFASLGSDRAYKILTEVYQEQELWVDYLNNLNPLRNEFPKYDTSYWYQNIYYAWLYSLMALNEPITNEYPDFMKNVAWKDKSLNTSLASWAEIRHDAILYAKAAYAESAGPEEIVKGYIEPNPEFYQRLEKTIQLMHKKLNEFRILISPVKQELDWFLEIIHNLKIISEKELKGISLSENEHSFVWNIGNIIEGFSCDLLDVEKWGLVSEPEKYAACIADVATSEGKCLEVGVGYGNTIYVMVPIEGKWILTKGAVFSYYEFLHPTSDRLTDEKWQEMIRQGKNPAPPIWTKSFLCP